MARKKTRLCLRKRKYPNKKTSRDKGKISNIALNSMTLQNQSNDLQLKFKLKDLRIILHDIAVDKTILPSTKSFVNKNVTSLKVIDKCKKYTNKSIYSGGKKSFVNSIVDTECSNLITSHAIAIEKHDTDEKITEKQNIDSDFDIQIKSLNVEGQETLSNSDSKSSKEKKKYKVASDVGYAIKSENTDLPIAATNIKKKSNKRIHSKDKFTVNSIVNIVYSNRISSAIAKEKHYTDEKITEEQNIDKNVDIQTKLLNAEKQEISFHRHTKVLSISDSKGSKKKKKRRATYDFGCTPKPENTNLPSDAINSNRNINTKAYSNNKKSFINNIINTECSNAIASYTISTGKHGTSEKKRNVDKNFNIQTQPLHAKQQETSFERHTKGHLISNGKGSKRKEKSRSTNDVYTVKPKNTDFPIVSTNNNQNKCLDIYNGTESVTNIDIENKERKQNINIYEQNGETYITNKDLIKGSCSLVQTDEKLSKKTQKILINLEDTNNDQNTLNGKNFPKITEEKMLTKNTILLKIQDNVQIINNSQDVAYHSNVILQNQSNESPSIEKYSKVVNLTEDNLYKFTENYNKSLAPKENVALFDTTANLTSSANSDSTEINLKTNKDMPSKKRGWIRKKMTAEQDKSGIKRIKLDRKRIKEKSCTITNSSVCSSDNKNSNLFSNCHSINLNNDKVQNMDSCLTLYSNNGNSLCTIQLPSVSPKTDCDDILRSTHVQQYICSSSHRIFNGESEKNELLLTKKYHQIAENIVENNLNENEILSCSTELYPQNQVKRKINDNHDDGQNDSIGDDINHNNNDGDDNGKRDGVDFDNRNNDGGNVNRNNDGGNDNRKNDGGNDNRNNNGGNDNKYNNDDNDDDDVISLFAESLSSECPMAISSEKKVNSTLRDYKMTGTTFDNYLEQNILECNKELDNIVENNTSQDESYQKPFQANYEEIEQNSIRVFERRSINAASIRSINSPVINNNNSAYPDKNYNKPEEDVCDDETVMTCTKKLEPTMCNVLCKGYCFGKMRHGDCNRTSCYFNHDLPALITTIILKYKQYLTSIIDYVHCMKFHYFLRKLYTQSLRDCNVACILTLYEKIYSIQYTNLDLICITVDALLSKGMHPKDVIDSLCKILNPTDMWTPKCIFNSIKNKIKVGEYWGSLRNLLKYVKPTKDITECILNDCLITRKNIHDVHINVIKRLHPLDVKQLDRNLILSFNNLLEHEYQNIPDKISLKSVSIPNNNDGSCNESYVLRSISDLPEAHSQYRDRFWKLYLMIYNIKQALVHEDYDYIISILNKYEEVDKETLFSRCCFHMLTAEIKHSEYHITKIIEHAVQIGASSILYKVLLDIATCILVKLIIKNAWTLAYKLLKTLQVYNLQHNAAFIILSAEIYLANKHAIKALMLIKQSNLISTNRNNWNVASNAQDYYSRTYVISTLLDVLCIKSPEHAFFIFQFLAKDQGNNSQPIDLTQYVDKLMLKLLTEKEIDLIIKMGYVIIEYNFSFFNVTICRAAIASIVHIDMVLAKQLYQYATGLGIYRTIELLPVIHVIINIDWVEEEIYLTFWDLFQRLVMDIGHSIDHLSPARLSVYVIFEIVPTEAHLYSENPDDQQMKKMQISKNLVRQVLCKRFEPPILPSRKLLNGAVIKLQSKVVINHLKEIYKNYSE